MAVLRILIYFVSGLMVIGAMACVGIFFHNGSVEAVGGAIMFFCFGVAGVLLGLYLQPILAALKPGGAARA